MQPEDIDKLFRDRLAHHAPTPPAYLWNQLEDELQPAKKRPVLWMWAAAASVVLLLVSGVLWLQYGAGRLTGSGAVATTPRTTQRVTKPTTQPASRPENKSVAAAATQATPPRLLPSTTPEAAVVSAPAASRLQTAKDRQLAAASAKETRSERAAPATRSATSATPRNTRPAPEAVAALAPKTQPERTSEPVEIATPEPRPLPALAALAAASAPTGPIEVEVRRSAPAAVATAAPAPAAARQRSLGGILLRQARNAVRGERVSLAQAGLPETVTVQAHVAGRTLTKVIQL